MKRYEVPYYEPYYRLPCTVGVRTYSYLLRSTFYGMYLPTGTYTVSRANQ